MKTNIKVLFATIAIAAVSTIARGADVKHSSFEMRFPSESALGKYVGSHADAALDSAAAGAEPESWDAELASAESAFDLVVAYGSPRDVDGFREAALARRLLRQLRPMDPAARQDLLKYLRAHDELARLVAFGIRDGDDVPEVYKLLDRLRHERPKQVDALPNLAVAISVVRDRPLERHVNENKVVAADPLAVFDFYSTHEKQMSYGLKEMPVELLIYVVDNTATVDEMTWALSKYAGTTAVGPLFFTIKYDHAYLEGKSPKKLDEAGFSLTNILKCGGVCIDQAYFATTVGKSIGVPTAIATASSAEAGHAWVGYVRVDKGVAGWNFDSGRYEAFKGIRGDVTDPQTGSGTADSSVSMVGDVIGTTSVQRQSAVAMVDAARALLGSHAAAAVSKAKGRHRRENEEDAAEPFVAPPVPDELKKMLANIKPRPTTAGALELIDAGIKQYGSYAPGWELVAAMAANDQLTEDQKHKWAETVQHLCGQKHPDFAVAVLIPMVQTVKDPSAQIALWDAVFTMVQKRADLAADVRLRQAELWMNRSDYTHAGQCYEDVIDRFINAGPFALTAVKGAEVVLVKMDQPKKVLDLYARAFKLVTKPDVAMSGEFVKQSNWYRLREAYAAKLEESGQSALAEQVRSDGGKAAAGL